MPSPSPHLIWSKSHNRCTRTSSKGRQGSVTNHELTTVLHLLLLCTIILPCSTDIPLSSNTFFTPSIHPVHYLTSPPHTSHLSRRILLFSSINWSSFILSMCSNQLDTLCSTRPVNSLVTSVLLWIFSLFTQSIYVPPHILLRHFIFIIFNIFFSATSILHVSSPYSAVGTATPSYNLLFIFILITLQLKIFILPNTLTVTLILDFASVYWLYSFVYSDLDH